MEDIYHYGEFCDSSDLGAEQIRCVYSNTCQGDDFLSRFCIRTKCSTNLYKHLGDAEFLKLCEDGGPFVADVFRACRKHISEEDDDDDSKGQDSDDESLMVGGTRRCSKAFTLE